MSLKDKNTYSLNAKEEILSGKIFSRAAKLAFLSGLVHTGGSIVFSSSVKVEVYSECDALPKTVEKIYSELFGANNVSTLVSNAGVNIITITGNKIEDFLIAAKILKRSEKETTVIAGIDASLVNSDAEAIAYIKGAFIGAGSVSLKKGYHLEFVVSTRRMGSDLCHLLSQFELCPKLTVRKEKCVIYFKDSQQLSDFLALTGATRAVLSLNNEVAARTLKGYVNRANNCDLHNLDKTVKASVRHCMAIKKIAEKCGLDTLDKRLYTVATLRLNNVDMTLDEMATTLSLTKSCVRHRLDKLTELSKKL